MSLQGTTRRLGSHGNPVDDPRHVSCSAGRLMRITAPALPLLLLLPGLSALRCVARTADGSPPPGVPQDVPQDRPLDGDDRLDPSIWPGVRNGVYIATEDELYGGAEQAWLPMLELRPAESPPGTISAGRSFQLYFRPFDGGLETWSGDAFFSFLLNSSLTESYGLDFGDEWGRSVGLPDCAVLDFDEEHLTLQELSATHEGRIVTLERIDP
jgi:hypothetical protein